MKLEVKNPSLIFDSQEEVECVKKYLVMYGYTVIASHHRLEVVDTLDRWELKQMYELAYNAAETLDD